MRIMMWSDPTRGSRLTDQLAERARSRGIAASVVPWDTAGADVGNAADGVAAAIDTASGPLPEKQERLAVLDRALPAAVPLLTCAHATSATEASALAAGTGRIIGFGLLPPIAARMHVECARAVRTADDAVAAAVVVWRALGLEPVWVADGAGLVTARIVACLANEAAFALTEGTASATDIDRAMTLGAGYPRGPLAWAAEVGVDQVLAILDGLYRERGEDRYRAAPLLRRLAAAGPSVAPPWPDAHQQGVERA